ncbi:hypothetical protein OHA_1_00117 [Pleomorphomonas sp. SM30]|uniref:Uncharacterized protein n=1 Tax=Oharaeibacter diazotrophicus TaxID=1920512 RepID=A0A4R6RLH6_9HYPH|nr:hypothetical protein EDD54_1399 [Oharaeibacter diazotrophicus]BBE70553.1 hypothetical protein OHA_1_00117 [Pleomorphomonas sp. SM30]
MFYLTYELWPYALLALIAGVVIGWFTTGRAAAD